MSGGTAPVPNAPFMENGPKGTVPNVPQTIMETSKHWCVASIQLFCTTALVRSLQNYFDREYSFSTGNREFTIVLFSNLPHNRNSKAMTFR